MASFKKLANGKTQARIYLGKDENKKSKFKKVTCNTLRECKAVAKDIERNYKSDDKPAVTVKTVLETYVKGKSAILSPSTLRAYNSYIKNKFADIRDIPLKELTQIDVQFSLNKEATISAPKTVKNIYMLLTSALSVYDINFKMSYPKRIKPQINIPDKRLICSLYDYFKNTDMFIPFLFAALMGMRRSEICALDWSDVDFKKHTLKISKAIVTDFSGCYVEKGTKTASSTREIYIPDVLFKILKQKRGIGKITNLNPNVISKRFHRALRRFSSEKIRFHDLRHYTASTLHALGIPDMYIIEYLGHSTDNMLKTTYLHTIESRTKKAAQEMDRYIRTVFK